jgi:5-methylcytosine-specific restriction endonuclease McrA
MTGRPSIKDDFEMGHNQLLTSQTVTRPDPDPNAAAQWEIRLDQIRIYEQTRVGMSRAGWFKNRTEMIHFHNTRADKSGQVGNLTLKDWSEILEHFGKRCAYCDKHGPMQIEHVIPICQGGPTSKNNIVPACRGRNSRKYTMSPEKWLDKMRPAAAASFIYKCINGAT